MLKKILFKVPLLHTMPATKPRHENQLVWKTGDEDCGHEHAVPAKKGEHDKFSVLRSMIPSLEKIDKASILDDTILYLKELEARVEELETCMESAELEGRNRRTFPGPGLRKTSDHSPTRTKRWINKRKASDIDRNQSRSSERSSTCWSTLLEVINNLQLDALLCPILDAGWHPIVSTQIKV
ncbi:hypothetical protein MLD38_023471 [Melastoma candidum]|uniref:Uncharacterized protein n=1 Tax=Melastoma candidum TaxID=119954 RepID=A0ACB9NQA3_9MYRT|nr:hypothetical protein MLD38_023471 [Melastoma candidum]